MLFIVGSLDGLSTQIIFFDVVLILYITVGVVVIRFRSYLRFRRFWMIFMCSRSRKSQRKLKFSALEFFGLQNSEVSFRLSLFSALRKVLQSSEFIGNRSAYICGLIFLKLGSVFFVGLRVSVKVSSIGASWIFLIVYTSQFISLYFSLVRLICFGVKMFRRSALQVCSVFMIFILSFLRRVSFLIRISEITFRQLSNYESIISVCNGFFGSFFGGGMSRIRRSRTFCILTSVFVEQRIASVASMSTIFLIFFVTRLGSVVGRLILFSIGIISRFIFMAVQQFVRVCVFTFCSASIISNVFLQVVSEREILQEKFTWFGVSIKLS